MFAQTLPTRPHGFDSRSGRAWPRRPPAPYRRKHLDRPRRPNSKQFRWHVQRAARAAMTAQIIGIRDYAMLMALLECSDGRGSDVNRIGQVSLGRWAGGISDRTVRRCRANLEAAGFLAVQHNTIRLRNGKVRERPLTYRVLLPATVEAQPADVEHDVDEAELYRPGQRHTDHVEEPRDELPRFEPDVLAKRQEMVAAIIQQRRERGDSKEQIATRLTESGFHQFEFWPALNRLRGP